MKIKKLFHWLYAILMFLPLFSVGFTAVYYGFNKNANVPTIEKNIEKEVDFNQQFEDLNANIFDVSVTTDSNHLTTIYGSTTRVVGTWFVLDNFDNIIGHKYLLSCIGLYNSNDSNRIAVISSSYTLLAQTTPTNQRVIFEVQNDNLFRVAFGTSYTALYDFQLYFNLFDLTQMFGSGYEPTLDEFDNWFNENYYDYTLSTHIVLPNYEVVEVSDNAINHIWLPSFGGLSYQLQGIFEFIITNMFGISSTFGIGLIICRLLTYWLAISLIWLVFDIIMYVPLLVHRWIDKGGID